MNPGDLVMITSSCFPSVRGKIVTVNLGDTCLFIGPAHGSKSLVEVLHPTFGPIIVNMSQLVRINETG